MTRFAQIAVNVPGVHDLFDYEIPAQFEQLLDTGWLVEVPFGSQTVQGIITSLKDSSDVHETRLISTILEDAPVLTRYQLQLGNWLSENYLSPISTYLFAMLPPGLGQRADTLYVLKPGFKNITTELSSLQKRILDKLQEKDKLRGRQLDAAFRHINWRSAMRALIRMEYIQSQAVLPKPAVKKKQIRLVSTGIPVNEIEKHLDQIGKPGSLAFQRRLAALRLLADEEKAVDVSLVYASSCANSSDLRYLNKKGLVEFGDKEVYRDPVENIKVEQTTIPKLTPDQNKAWQRIQTLVEKKEFDQPILMHGVTGSGKTELYMRAIQKTIESGRQAVVIVPEISMTPQAVQRFIDRFPGQVSVIHSKLSPGERYDTWRRAREGEFSIVVGARSALFTPFPDPGVIIIDESHDDSLYQTEMGPYYHAVKAAAAMGRFSQSLVIYGSATPTIEMYFQAQYEDWPLIELPKRVLAHKDYLHTQNIASNSQPEAGADSLPLPDVHIVDMRVELKQGNLSIFSREMQKELESVLDAGQQAILLLNRRGSATYVFCRDCGYTMRCPRCDFPLTYHRSILSLTCHTCGYSRKIPSKCPQCGSHRIKQFGTGTEKVEEELQKIFPKAGILRWDADTSRGKGAEEIILSHFKQHNADFLIGTQMLAKGLDLPLVTLVGVVLADVGLNFPDYRTAERAFQLFTQVAGRAGRSALGGSVIIQTFQPDNYAIQYAADHDFSGFYRTELEQRRKLHYPPFTRLVLFEARDAKNDDARLKAFNLASRLKALIKQSADRSLSMNGPLPPYFSKRSGNYRWQIILRGTQPGKILKELDLSDYIVEIDPPSLL